MPTEPTGKTDTVKHSFYARQFRKGELAGLSTLQEAGMNDLASEISLLRIAILRCLEQVSAADEVDWIAVLSSIGLAATRIASLLRTQKILEGDQRSAVIQTLTCAIAEIANKEWK